MIRVGVIGYGYWGPNLVRNFGEAKESEIACIADLRPERRALAATRYRGVETTEDAQALIQNPKIDAVVIATPVSGHYPLALAALQAG